MFQSIRSLVVFVGIVDNDISWTHFSITGLVDLLKITDIGQQELLLSEEVGVAVPNLKYISNSAE